MVRFTFKVLLASGFSVFAAFPAPTAAQAQDLIGQPTVDPASVPGFETDFLTVVNRERLKAGCEPLTQNSQLERAAVQQSGTMAQSGRISHADARGEFVEHRVSAQGYNWGNVGEILAGGAATPEEAVQMWLTSPDHREILLDCSYSDTGFAVTFVGNDTNTAGGGPYFTYWTQVFGHNIDRLEMPARHAGPQARAFAGGNLAIPVSGQADVVGLREPVLPPPLAGWQAVVLNGLNQDRQTANCPALVGDPRIDRVATSSAAYLSRSRARSASDPAIAGVGVRLDEVSFRWRRASELSVTGPDPAAFLAGLRADTNLMTKIRDCTFTIVGLGTAHNPADSNAPAGQRHYNYWTAVLVQQPITAAQ